MNHTRSLHNSTCAELMVMAERELAAFLSAVTELYGNEQAKIAAAVWLNELEGMNGLPGPASRDWRTVTVAALARLASRLPDAKVSAIPMSNCCEAALLV